MRQTKVSVKLVEKKRKRKRIPSASVRKLSSNFVQYAPLKHAVIEANIEEECTGAGISAASFHFDNAQRFGWSGQGLDS